MLKKSLHLKKLHFLSPDFLFFFLDLARHFHKDREKDPTREKKLRPIERLQMLKNLMKKVKDYEDLSEV